jgi:hypothetical protein
MAVIVYVSNPPALLSAIRATIAAGTIQTWSVDADGDFTHSPEQWRLKAWFRAKLSDDKIAFRIISPQKVTMNRATYAVYHGRFIEMLLTHFDEQFQRAVATALPTEGDNVTGV